MLRDKWEFKFDASALAAAAKAKLSHHEARMRFWKSAQEKVMAEVRESGIEVAVSEAGLEYHSNRVMAPQVMVRNDLQTKLTECHKKIQEHANALRQYQGWLDVLNGNPKERLSLHADDYLFFFNTEPNAVLP